ncbi:MAG TPA: gamma-glutamyltransferase, partial [Gemmatimonadota bacterium]|nr:gamma-glutamyltransferase [Gemmatimonadota bacterium]
VARIGHYTRSAEALYRFMRIAHVQHVMNWVDPDIRSAALPQLTASQPARGTREHARMLWEIMRSDAWTEALEADNRTRRGSMPGGHTDAVVAVDERGNVAALTYSSNTAGWGRTGLFVDGVSIPDPGAFSQKSIARTGPGRRLPIALNPLLVLDDGAPVLASAAIGPGIHETTLQNLMSVLDFGMDPAQANEAPEFLLYLYTPIQEQMRDLPVHTRAVPAGEFDSTLLDSVRAMGQPVVEVESALARGLRGYWIGIRIDPATRMLQGAASRFFGGTAEGY